MKSDTKSDRRQHSRFPIADGLMEPIEIVFDELDGSEPRKVPAILTNLSAGGMSLVLFCQPPHSKEIELAFRLPGMKDCTCTAKVLRIIAKGEVFAVGLTFTKISKQNRAHILQLANDFNDCETRISLQLPEACVPDCGYHSLCSKPQKSPHWPPKV